jgi:hypothetical protein
MAAWGPDHVPTERTSSDYADVARYDSRSDKEAVYVPQWCTDAVPGATPQHGSRQ